jgi:hypothetical protein
LPSMRAGNGGIFMSVDLSVDNFFYNDNAVNFSVSNSGTTTSGPITVNVYLSTEATVTPADTVVATQSIDGLGAGGGAFYVPDLVIPDSLAKGH